VGDASRGAEQACHPGAGDGGGQHSVAATRTALYLRIISVSFCGVTGHLPVTIDPAVWPAPSPAA